MEEKMNVQQNNNQKKNEERRDDYRMQNYYHPFWSLFNDCFGSDDAQDVMKTDISEDDKGYRLEVEVPGVDKNDIRISLDRGYLTVSAKVNKHSQNGHGKYLRSERYEGSFSRSFYVGDAVKREDVDATCDKGVLNVYIKKPEELKQEDKYIQVK